jgi:acyl-CoA thioesterase YciA
MEPKGTLMLRTMSMPADANPNGDIFGGWLMSQMDTAGAIMAYEMCRGKVVTVAVDQITFKNPVNVGDVVCCYCSCIHIGHTSIKIQLELWARKNTSERITRVKVTEAGFTYVAVDNNGQKRPLPQYLIDNKEEILTRGYLE